MVKGRLSAPGYTVVVLGFGGKAVVTTKQSFSLRAPDSEFTLQLLNKRGVYAGPVVVAGSGSRVIMGLRRGVNVGLVKIYPTKGYARVEKPVAASFIVPARWAHAHGGVPIGNGRNFGFVRSKANGSSGPGGDLDHSGVPNVISVAPGGNLVLQSLVPSGTTQPTFGPVGGSTRVGGRAIAKDSSTTTTLAPANGSPGTQSSAPTRSPWMAQLFLPMDGTVNADAATITKDEIDSALSQNLNIKYLGVPQGDIVALNCNGLTYCSPGGTGLAVLEGAGLDTGQGNFGAVAFPEPTAANGYGQLRGPAAPTGLLGEDNPGQEFSLDPHATSNQIGSGDVITALVTSAGTTVTTPTTLDFVFTTVPAIASYADSAGDSGTINYPDTSSLGSANNPIRVAAGSNGDVVVTFTFWRPQRAGISGAGEPAEMDIGHLAYTLDHAGANVPGQVTSNVGPQCSARSYSGLSSDLSLSTVPSGGNSGAPLSGLAVDVSADQPASASNTLSFTVDLTTCLADKGQSLVVGQATEFDLAGNSQGSFDHANQDFWVERTS